MTKTSAKLAMAAAVALGGAFLAGPASAAPTLDRGLATHAAPEAAKPEAVRWVCGPYRCRFVPGPRFYYGPPRFYGGPRFYGPRRFYGGPRFYGPRPFRPFY